MQEAPSVVQAPRTATSRCRRGGTSARPSVGDSVDAARRKADSARVALCHAMRHGTNYAPASSNASATLAGCGVTPQASRKQRHVARNSPPRTHLEIRFRIRGESPAALVQRHPHMLRKTRRSGRPKRKLLASAAVHVLGTPCSHSRTGMQQRSRVDSIHGHNTCRFCIRKLNSCPIEARRCHSWIPDLYTQVSMMVSPRSRSGCSPRRSRSGCHCSPRRSRSGCHSYRFHAGIGSGIGSVSSSRPRCPCSQCAG